MANFCTNCGARLRMSDNFCIKCGTKIKKSTIKYNNPSSKPMPNNMEKDKTKKEIKRVVGEVESGMNQLMGKCKTKLEKEMKDAEERNRKKKMIDRIFESPEIKSEIRKDRPIDAFAIKGNLENKIINERENMSEDEIKHFIKSELRKAREREAKASIAKEKEMGSKKTQENKAYGSYCNQGCRHCYEQYIHSGGEVDFDFTGEEIIDYFCNLGHSISFGRFCKDYET